MSRRSKLDIVIGGNPSGALRALRSVGAMIGAVHRRTAAMASGLGRMSGLAGILGGAGLGFAAAGITRYGLKANATFEDLRVRLKYLIGDSKKAEDAFKSMMAVYVDTDFGLEEITRAGNLLRSVGVSGLDSFKAVSSAADALGLSIEAVASGVAGLQVRSLRQVGISIEKAGEGAALTWRNKFGKAMSHTVDNADAARKAIIKILQLNYGGFGEAINDTLKDIWATFKRQSQVVLAAAFDGVAVRIKKIFRAINVVMSSMLDNKKLNSFSDALGKTIDKFAGLFSPEGRKAFGEEFLSIFSTVTSRMGEAFRRISEDFGDTVSAGILRGLSGAFMGTQYEGFGNLMQSSARKIDVESMYRARQREPISKMFPFTRFEKTGIEGEKNIEGLVQKANEISQAMGSKYIELIRHTSNIGGYSYELGRTATGAAGKGGTYGNRVMVEVPQNKALSDVMLRLVIFLEQQGRLVNTPVAQ